MHGMTLRTNPIGAFIKTGATQMKRTDSKRRRQQIKLDEQVAFTKFGLLGVDVKSHQINISLPYPAINIGNDKQDRSCEDARLLPTPSAIKIQSGGPFAYLCKHGDVVRGS